MTKSNGLMDFSAFFAASPAQQGAPRRERRENPIAFLNLAPLVFPLWPFLGHAGGRAPRKGALGMAFRDFLRPKGLPYFSVSGKTSLPNHFYDPFLLLAGFSTSRPQCPAFGRLDFWRRKRSFLPLALLSWFAVLLNAGLLLFSSRRSRESPESRAALTRFLSFRFDPSLAPFLILFSGADKDCPFFLFVENRHAHARFVSREILRPIFFSRLHACGDDGRGGHHRHLDDRGAARLQQLFDEIQVRRSGDRDRPHQNRDLHMRRHRRLRVGQRDLLE